jgi:hypothetical protein
MTSIRVWNLESDHDVQAVKFLEGEFVKYRQLGYLAIRKTGRSALRKCHRKGAPISSSLRKAIEHYLKQDDYIIFILDSGQQASKLLANEVKQVVKDCKFSDRVFFAPDIQKSEYIAPIQWENIVSRFRSEIEIDHKQFQNEWDKTVGHFHDAFADTPEEEVIRDFEEALAEVRRERT